MLLSVSAVWFIAVICTHKSTVSALNDDRDLLLNAKEKSALDQFKSQIKDLPLEDFMKSDFYLIRWVRVAELDVPKAVSLLRQNIKWRETNNIANILSEDFSDMEEDFPISFDGHDKKGRPIMTLDLAAWDLRRAALQGKVPRVQRYLTQAAERITQKVFATHKGDKPVTRQLVMMDVDGFNAIQQGCVQCLAVIANWAMVGDTYYPMFNDEIIIINAPQIAVIALNTIRPLLSAESRNTIKLFNTNKDTWMKYLDERIDKSQRAPRYGGTKNT